MPRKTVLLHQDEAGNAAAAQVLQGGGLVAFATETVYGLGADARNGVAVAAVYEAKGRPSFNPLIVHVADVNQVAEIAQMSPLAVKLAAAFWPGPMSLVLPVRKDAGLSSLVTAGLDTVAVRVPAHTGARALLQAFAGAIAAPSANMSGSISPTQAVHVMDGLSGRIDVILDGGNCAVGVESTILKVDDRVSLLRAGGVAVEDVEAVIGQAVLRPDDPETPQSPGQLASHYAPQSALRMDMSGPAGNAIVIGFGAGVCDFNLSEGCDLNEAAANLFAMLRQADTLADERGVGIVVRPVPSEGLGLAINDRLRRAAA